MPKQLNVNLAFTADTSQAKKQLQDLQNQLTKLTNNSLGNSKLDITKEIQNATSAAAQLKVQLEKATNVDTGKLDLSKFVDSMNKSGMDLEQYRKQLSALGPEGSKAFMSLAQSIANAEIPLRRSNALLDQFWVSLKNTARWQLSSSALHGFMGAIQGAYGYAQDLNKSLTSIAIVTGNSVDNMRDFADQANKSAQALSTSTLAYTDAALIYYQQGLQGQEVADRVETTLKLSNVTGESAEEVSSYMTAIWNNFRKGGEDLESFADKITALGAATASSSREIAGGLQQFAAVADTVGLSYDYAATALATVVAQTRQSESTVGNAFRTIFSRLEGLKLGETLEDGTDLNKYSAALETIGVSIKDQNGELRQMDDILDDIGARWQTLSRDQQMALAQTVGGVRQYSNLIALFDNWDKFQKNLQVSLNADGTLQEQADIYAESWEAAQKRVRAAWQAIYQDLINDKFFIGILNFITKIINGVDSLIKSAGGLKTVLAGLTTIMLSLFGDKVAASVKDIGYGIKMMSASGKQELEDQRTKAFNEVEKLSVDTATNEGGAQADIFKNTAQLQKSLIENAKFMSEEELKRNQILLDGNKILQDRYLEAAKNADNAEKEQENAKKKLRRSTEENGVSRNDFNTGVAEIEKAQQAYHEFSKALEEPEKNIETLKESLTHFSSSTLDQASSELWELINKVYAGDEVTYEQLQPHLTELSELLDIELDGALIKVAGDFDTTASEVYEYADSVESGLSATDKMNDASNRLNQTFEYLKTTFENAKGTIVGVSELFVDTVRFASQLYLAYENLSKAMDILNDKNITLGERVKKALPLLAIALPSALNSIKGLYKTLITDNVFLATGTASVSAAFTSAAATGGTFAGVLAGIKVALIEIILPLTAIIAILALVKIGWDAWYSTTADGRLKEATKNLEKANEELERSKTAAAEAASAYQELNDIFSNFGDKQNEIAKLTKGTREWRQAISESNVALINALNAAGALGEVNLKYDGNGFASIGSQDREKALDIASNNKQIQELRELQSQIIVQHQKTVVDLTKLTGDVLKAEGKRIEDWDTPEEVKSLDSYNDPYEEYNKTRFSGVDDTLQTLENYGQLLANAGYGGVDAETIKQELEKGNDKLSFLNEIPNIADRSDLLQAISDAAEKIAASDMTSDAYKAEIGSQFMQNQGMEVPDFAYEEIAKRIGQSIAVDEATIESRADALTAEDKALYAQNTEGVSWNGKNFTNDQGEVLSIDPYSVASLVTLIEAINNSNPEDFSADIQAAKEKSREDLANNTLASSGIEGSHDSQEFIDWYNQLSEEELSLLAKIEVDEDDSLEDIQKKMEDMSHQLNFKIDADVDPEELENLKNYIYENASAIDELDDHLSDCEAEANKVAHAILRFDDAIQNVSDNYDDWMAQLSSGSFQDVAASIDDIKDAYGDLLDIDPSVLGDKFLRSTENMQDMKAAIEGDEEAYNRLQEAMGQDILAQIGLDTSQYESDKAWIMEDIKSFTGQDWGQIEVGADLNNQAFLDKLSDMVTQAGMTAEQATAYLASMGIDAEIETVPEDIKTVKTTRQYWVPPTYTTNPIPNVGGTSEPETYNELVVDTPGHFEPVEENSEEEASPNAWSLKVTSAHKSSGGNFKYKNASHGAGSKGAGAPSKGSGKGGGGGGGKDKKKTTKEPAKKKFEEDRYHNIKSAIDEVAKALERVNKLKDRAYGKAKLKYMDQEIAKLKDQVRLQNEYIKQAETYLKMDRAKLEGLGMGAEFTDEGRLINYEQVLSNLVDKYNDAVDARNAAAEAFNNSAQEEGDTEAFDAAEKRLKKAEEAYNEEKKILDQYEKTYNTLQDQIDKRTEILNKIYDAKLAKVVYKVDIQLEFNDADIKYLEWLNKFLEKNLDNAEDIMANLSKAAQRTFKDIEAINQGLVELFANHEIKLDFNNMNPDVLVKQLQDFMDKEGLGSEITEAEAKQIRDWNDKLMDYMSKWVEYWDKTHEMIDKVFEDYTKNVDREIDKMDAYTKLLDHYLKMLDLSGGADRLGFSAEDILNVYDTRIQNEQNILSSLVTERKALEQTLLDYQKNLSEAETEEAKQYWENHIKNAEDALQDVKDKVISATESTLEAVNERIEKAMELAEKQFKKRFDNLDLLMERFDRQQELDHLYLDDYEKYYELNKSAKELQKAIEGTNNAMMRGRFKDLQDEINASMSSGVKLSQLQTDIIAKRVELLKAEDELLNARNAKNTVRMTRDNEGNYSYTYTADQDMIDDAELNYNEKFYQLMNAERSGQEELQSQRLDYLNNYTSVSQDLMNKLQTGAISQDQYDEAMAELQDQFQEYMDYYLEQLQFLYDEQATLRDDDLVNAQELTELKLANYDDFITQYEDTILGRLFDDVSSEEEFTRLALEAMAQYHQENAEALNVWEGEVATTYEAAGLDVDNFRDTVNADLADVDQKSQETKEKITEMTDKMREDMQAVMEKALAMDQDWAQRMRSMRDQISQTVDSLNKMLEKLADVTEGFGYTGKAAEFAGAKYLEAGKDADVATKAFEAMEKAARAAEQAAKDALAAVNALKNADPPSGGSWAPVHNNGLNGYVTNGSGSGGQQLPDWYDTGGYTGAFGSEGKLAMLHEKELVLNESDTSNMLNIVGMTRDLIKNFDPVTGLNNLVGSIANSSALALNGMQDLNQNVHIEASFPNVQSHSEIELAFENLINSTTQYIHRK